MKRAEAIAGTLVIFLIATVTLVHDGAHQNLGVELGDFQNLYVYTVIVGAPLLALALLWTSGSIREVCCWPLPPCSLSI